MVLILDGNSEICTHVQEKSVNLICLMHLFSSGKFEIHFQKRHVFPHALSTCFELPSNMCTMRVLQRPERNTEKKTD